MIYWRWTRRFLGKEKKRWIVHTPYHWGLWVDGKKLDYYPTKDKWVYDGKVRVGGLDSWLRKKGIKV